MKRALLDMPNERSSHRVAGAIVGMVASGLSSDGSDAVALKRALTFRLGVQNAGF